MRLLHQPRNINYNEHHNGHFTGDVTIDGTLEVGGETTLTGNTSIGGTLEVTGVTALSSFSTTADAVIGGSITVTGATNLSTLVASGSANILGNLGVTGVVTMNGASVTIANLIENNTGNRVVTQQATALAATDKLIQLRTTGAGGPFVITPTNIGNQIYKVTIIMTAFNTAEFTLVCLQGTVHWGAVGDVASFINYGSGQWSLMGAPQGCTIT